MKIGVLTSSYPQDTDDSSNAGLFVMDVVSILVESGHEVTVVSLDKVKNGSPDILSCNIFSRNLDYSSIRKKNFVKILQSMMIMLIALVRIPFWAKSRKWEVTISFWSLPSGVLSYFLFKLIKVPYLTWILGSDINRSKEILFGNYFNRLVVKNASAIYADSPSLCRMTENITGSKPLFLASSTLRREFNLIKDSICEEPYFLAVGRLQEVKGFDLLIDSYARLKQEVTNLPKLHIYGTGSEKGKLLKQINESDLAGCVKLMGQLDRSSFVRVLEKSELLVIPSRNESIPLILGEGTRFANKILVTDVGDMGNLVRKYKAGVVVEPTIEGLRLGLLNTWKTESYNYELGRRELSKVLSLVNSVERLETDLRLLLM